MALAGARRSEKERVLALLNEACSREFVDQHAVHLLVEIKIKGVERAVGISKAGEFVTAGQEAVFTALQFVRDERGDEIEGRQPFRLGVTKPRLEDVCHRG